MSGNRRKRAQGGRTPSAQSLRPALKRKDVTRRHSVKRMRLLWKARQRRFRAKKKKMEIAAGVQVRTYEEMIEAFRLWRKELGLTQEEVNAIAGFQDGYVNKLEVGYKEGGRGVGAMSLATWMDALGVRLLVVQTETDGPGRKRVTLKKPDLPLCVEEDEEKA